MRSSADMLSFPEAADLADEVRRLFEDLQHAHDAAPGGLYAPPMDVVEREDSLEVVMDLAGVAAEDVRVLFKANTLVIAGCKWPTSGAPGPATAFHLVERSFGRFARAVRVTATLDLAGARATMTEGELRVRLPKLHNGQEFVIPIEKVV
jgi:HSP20 family protein